MARQSWYVPSLLGFALLSERVDMPRRVSTCLSVFLKRTAGFRNPHIPLLGFALVIAAREDNQNRLAPGFNFVRGLQREKRKRHKLRKSISLLPAEGFVAEHVQEHGRVMNV